MKLSDFSPPKGFRDYLPEDFSAREHLKRIIADTYQLFGYQPIDTPVMEKVEVLLGKGGGENEKLMFKVLKRGRKLEEAIEGKRLDDLADMGLRFDLTVPLARFVAANRDKLPAVFKRYQISPVWRADRPQFGRFREFVQCDVDVIGSSSMAAEADVISATSACLVKLGFKGMQLRINNRPLVSVIVGKMGVAEDHIEDALRALDKIDRMGIEGALKEMESAGISGEACEKTGSFYREVMSLDNKARLKSIKDFCGSDADVYVNQLNEILEICPVPDEVEIVIDPFLVRGMDYYTGPIFEIRLPDAGFSVAGGGRYDRLIGQFSGGKDIPATGFSIGFERILELMKEKGLIPSGIGTIDVVMCADSEKLNKTMLATANKARSRGLRVDVSLGTASIGKVMQAAEKRNAAFGVIFKENDENCVEIRNLKTRESNKISIDEAVETIMRSNILPRDRN